MRSDERAGSCLVSAHPTTRSDFCAVVGSRIGAADAASLSRAKALVCRAVLAGQCCSARARPLSRRASACAGCLFPVRNRCREDELQRWVSEAGGWRC